MTHPNQYSNNTNKDEEVSRKQNTTPPLPIIVKPKDVKTTDSNKNPTIIPIPKSRQMYELVKIPYPNIPEEMEREVFERQTKGIWTRKVTKIVWFNTLDDEQFLDWDEEREGKTDMKRKLIKTISHVPRYIIPTPSESVEYDPDSDENRLVTGDREQNREYGWEVTATKEHIELLVEDAKPRQCEYIISQIGARPYTTSKKEMLKYGEKGDFETLYRLKSDPDFKETTTIHKQE